jgi:hypothetical protein
MALVLSRMCPSHPLRITLASFTLVALLGLAADARAQSEDDWGVPVNLSQSGAAEQSRIVAGPNGTLQVFWWDRFDGLMTAIFNGRTWSDPLLAPILTVDEPPANAPLTGEQPQPYSAVSAVPTILSDGSGWVHALWLAKPDEKTGVQALMHSQMPLGTTTWSEPEAVAESAVAFDVTQGPSGALTLAYARALHTDAFPAGVYVKRNPGGGANWGDAAVVHATIYFRLLTSEEGYVRVTDGGFERLHVVWEDPRLEEALYAGSVDGGVTWMAPTSLGEAEQRPVRPRVLVTPDGGALRLWEASALGGCTLYQQRLLGGGATLDNWSDAEHVLKGLSRCPEGERSWVQDGALIWLWGEGTGALSLAAWDAGQGRWSEPYAFDFRFQDPLTGSPVGLRDLHAVPTAGTLSVVGSEPAGGEVWHTLAQVGVLELAAAPSPTLLGLIAPVDAEPEPAGNAWSTPVNLSQSGAAEQPRIVAGPDGTLQVFWWDRFDGLMTALFNGETRSTPTRASIPVTQVAEGEGEKAETIAVVPTILSDGSGWVHALWLAKPNEKTGVQALLHSQMPLGTTTWSEPEAVAESAVTFDVARGPEGGLTLAYARALHTDVWPAGVYVKRNAGGGANWDDSVVVHDTIYLRLLTPEEGYVRVADGGGGRLHVVWEDSRLKEALYAGSVDGGASWSEPQTMGEVEQRPVRPRVLVTADGGVLRLWEASASVGCTLYQQRQLAGTGPAEWSAAEHVLKGLSRCPEGERSWVQDDALIWLWGEGTGAVSLAVWDPGQGRWSESRAFDFRFQDPLTGNPVSLEDLHAVPTAGTLAALGSEPGGGEVWATLAEMDALELAYAPPSPWTEPERLSRVGAETGWADVAIDAEGGVHVVWSEREAGGGADAVLLYAQRGADAKRWSGPVELVADDAGEGMARQPALLLDGRGLVHLVWSGGRDGQILYSRAQVDRAVSVGEWSIPHTVSDPEMPGAWPQIGFDGAGRLVVVYVVPLNEGRGVYLVRSEDEGTSWSKPELLFDAQAAGWAMVDHLALAVASDGTTHAAWVHAALPDAGPPLGIFYVRVDPFGMAPGGPALAPEPRELVDAGYDWPQLALTGKEVHLLYTAAVGGVWQRAYGMTGESSDAGWRAPGQVPGLSQAAGPVGAAADGAGTLHVVGAGAGGEGLLYTNWDGARWSGAETVELASDAAQAVEAGLGAAVATLSQGGRLAVALNVAAVDAAADDLAGGVGADAVPTLYYVARVIPIVAVSAVETATSTLPTSTPESAGGESTALPTLAVPTSTPDLMAGPTPSSLPVDPRILGGGIAAVLVVGALLTWPLWGKRR